MRAERKLFTLILEQWTGGDIYNRSKLREGFIKHNEHVRVIVPKENLLVFEARDGWEPLCKFLGKPVPEGPYPRINEGSNAANIHKPLFLMAYIKFASKVIAVPVVAWGISWGLRRYGWSWH